MKEIQPVVFPINLGTANKLSFAMSVNSSTIGARIGYVLTDGSITPPKVLSQDGLPDLTFDIDDGFNGTVSSVYVQSDGKILVGGAFTTYKGITQYYTDRLNTDGSLDSTFDIGNGTNNSVNTIGF